MTITYEPYNQHTKKPNFKPARRLKLLGTSDYEIFEVVEELGGIAINPDVGADHGVFVFSIIHLLKVIPEVMHGLEELEKAKGEDA